LYKAFKREGILTFWKGTTPRLGKLIFSNGIAFTVYEETMGLLKSHFRNDWHCKRVV